ncbi:hypothetical protein BDR03DRAFT_959582 [Suillus americanus]|nr:hypothetical protein BDR03DRAFT_959582 [Suillus americanus]
MCRLLLNMPLLCLLRIAWGMVGNNSVHIAEAAVEFQISWTVVLLMTFSSSVRPFGIRMYHNLLLSLLAAVIPWSLQTNLVVVSWAFFSNLSFRLAYVHRFIYCDFFFFNAHTDILSTCTASTFLSFRCPPPCRSFVSYSPLLIVIWSCLLFSVVSRPS